MMPVFAPLPWFWGNGNVAVRGSVRSQRSVSPCRCVAVHVAVHVTLWAVAQWRQHDVEAGIRRGLTRMHCWGLPWLLVLLVIVVGIVAAAVVVSWGEVTMPLSWTSGATRHERQADGQTETPVESREPFKLTSASAAKPTVCPEMTHAPAGR